MNLPVSFKRVSATAALALLATTSIVLANEPAPKIKLAQFEVTHPDANCTKLVMAGEGTDIAAGSYFIRIDLAPKSVDIDSLEGVYERKGYYYVNGGTDEKPSPNLMDNGPQDEDLAKGVFAYSFYTKNWPDGRYMLLVGAQNRPASGIYMAAPKGFVITKGKVSPLQISNIPSETHQAVYQKEGVYAVFPDLFILRDGKIGTRFSTKSVRSHIAQSSGVSLISADDGKTWKDAHKPLIDRRWQTKDGSLVLPAARGWIYVDASREEELEKQHKYIMVTPSGKIAYLGGALFRTSTDGGKTWKTQEIKLPENCVGLMNHHAYATYVVTKKGVRLRAIYGRRYISEEKKQGKDEVYFLRSTDDGKTWTCYPMYPDGPPNPARGFNETAIAQAADGTIVAMMRSTDQGYFWQSNSKDDGLTWSAPVKTPIWGFPADLIRLKDGRLLCTYGYRRAPMGIRASLSSDNGKTWDVEHELILRQDGFGSPGDLGYPLAYQLPDGKIFTIYYITTDGQNTHIASTIYDLPKK